MSASEKISWPAFALLITLAGAPSACVTKVDVPDPPNLDAIAASYDHPTGVLTTANVESTVARLVSNVSVVDRANPMATIWTLMDTMAGALGDQGISTKEEGDPEADIQVNALATAHLVCPGWTTDAKPDPITNGTITLQTVVRSNRLSRVVWGDAFACKAKGGAAQSSGAMGTIVPATFDGGIRIHRFDPIATPPTQGHFLVQVLGTLQADALTFNGADFRLSPGLTEIRIVLADGSGDVIGSSGLTGLTSVKLRAANGDFVCDVVQRRCVANDGRAIGW
jgi:hypothetical protein